ncbi:hypothetical protein BN85403840 [Alteracholeplasma palmae J233]|uniref:Uncharacterized protein n=1 Tax=Alteracholeplasma palmae (strain ATCC 49389 / J233) TaxID=1318466 RepID=U4KR94_ALTPJ|nr:hypothetical protein [Alteracholeplasma palmae]CCV63961.1 hypothetical protein BN85403840 [Alteracholeplasma palmae J233]
MEILGKKSNAAYYLNIILIAVIFLSAVFLFIIGFLKIDELSTILFIAILALFVIAPIKEIQLSKKRNEVIIFKKGNNVSVTNLKNEVLKLNEINIINVKKYKIPFLSFGTLMFYTETKKVKCSYIKKVDEVYDYFKKEVISL